MKFENIRINNIDLVIRYIPKQKRMIARNRSNHIIGIKLGGADFHDFGYQTFTLEENCIYFFNQRDNYDVDIDDDSGTAFSVHFTTTEPIETDSFCIKIKNRDEIINILEKIERYNMVTAHGDSMVLSLLYKLCAIYSDIKRKAYAPFNNRIEEAKEYIERNFKDDNCLERASALYGTKKRRFNDVFRQHFNTTPNRYITNCRISFAKELLASGVYSVGDVALLSGYSDIYYFSKVFKNETGVNPGRYKAYVNREVSNKKINCNDY